MIVAYAFEFDKLIYQKESTCQRGLLSPLDRVFPLKSNILRTCAVLLFCRFVDEEGPMALIGFGGFVSLSFSKYVRGLFSRREDLKEMLSKLQRPEIFYF